MYATFVLSKYKGTILTYYENYMITNVKTGRKEGAVKAG